MKILKCVFLTLVLISAALCASAADVTRADFTASLCERAGIAPVIYADAFSDVTAADAFADALQGAVDARVIDAGGSFRPASPITRTDAVSAAVRALVYLKFQANGEALFEQSDKKYIDEAEKTQLLARFTTLCETLPISVGDASLDKKIAAIRATGAPTARFNEAMARIREQNSPSEVTRGYELLDMEYGACMNKRNSILTGSYIFDDNGGLIQAHGGNIMWDEASKKYYWYGEARETSAMPEHLKKYASWGWRIGVACYSSSDLYNWKYEALALEMPEGEVATEYPLSDISLWRVIERPKVIYNEKTHKYVMWMHIDTGNYGYSRAGVAVSDSPMGPFEYLGSYRPGDKMARDMTVFTDDDGKAYIYFSTDENGNMACCALSEDYLKCVGEATVCIWWKWREAPAVFKYNSTYYMITSGCSGWAPNAADYATAPSPMGPWTQHGNPCVGEGADKTFNSQSSWVLPIDAAKGHFIYIGDIWRPSHHSESSFVWLPIQMQSDGYIRIEWLNEWRIEDFGNIRELSESGVPQKPLVAETEKSTVYRTMRIAGSASVLTLSEDGTLSMQPYERMNKGQLWSFDKALGGGYSAMCARPFPKEKEFETRCLDVANASKDAGANVITYRSTGGANQHWLLEKTEGGAYLLKSVNSDLYLTLTNGTLTQEALGKGNQTWILKIYK